MFGCEKSSADDERDEIKCIFFSEFHPTAGPKIVFQVPLDYIGKEEFDLTSVYIITKPELRNKIITVNVLGHKILGCPVCIDNPKYARNALIFNLCFVFNPDAETIYHEDVVKKLASYFTTLETESGLLSKEEYKKNLPGILSNIREELNLLGTCCVQVGVDFITSIQLKVVTPHNEPGKILGHQVPILNTNQNLLVQGQWDLATHEILTYIDGFRHIAKIAAEADVEIDIVKTCIQNLRFHNAVKIIPIFQYSNVYLTTPTIHKFTEDEDFQDECVQYVAKRTATGGQLPTMRNILQLFSGFKAGTTVRDLCNRFNPHIMHIDEKKLIHFGLIKGVIRRLEKYPVRLSHERGSFAMKPLYRWMNGRHSFDEICCKTGISFQELDDKVDRDPSIAVCWK